MQILSDEHLFARDRGAEIRDVLDRVAELADATSDPLLEAFVLTRRGLALHIEFLSDPGAGEPPEEMALFESALEIRKRLGDRRGEAESLSTSASSTRSSATTPSARSSVSGPRTTGRARSATSS